MFPSWQQATNHVSILLAIIAKILRIHKTKPSSQGSNMLTNKLHGNQQSVTLYRI